MYRFYPLFCFTLLNVPAADARELSKVPIVGGKNVEVHHSHGLFQADPGIHHAVIVVHGVLRNSGSYFDRMSDAVALSGLQRETLVVAPGIKIERDAGDDEYYWSGSGWSQGNLALNGRGESKVSSFDVWDQLLSIVSDPANFPSLKTVAVIGHSAGGQFVNRYASAAKLPQDREVDVRFIILNPSSYMYPDARRLLGGKVVDANELTEEFASYNQYRYGTSNLNTAMRQVGIHRIREQLFTRNCFYFVGSKDTGNSRLDIRPGAMVQGGNRFARFCSYRDFVAAHEDPRWQKNSQFAVVNGVGHHSGEMFASDAVRNALFGNKKAPATDWSVDGLKSAREF